MSEAIITEDHFQTIENGAKAAQPEMEKYLRFSEESFPNGLYAIIKDAFERPLLEAVMQYTKNNQVNAAKLMGISRGTLRTKLKQLREQA